ncbi:MAG TPA: sigma-70 family RNA polymerase sigma factor [Flavisolibacter sp.]|nr:sigma-70 family RNA polymerase sigma factor [Flavisolibacter sp.]
MGHTWHLSEKEDKKAFACLYEQYFDQLFNYAIRFCADREQVKEYIQEMFIKLWRNRHNLNKATNIEHYLMGALRNVILKKQSYKTRFVFEELEEESYDFEMAYPAEHRIIQTEQQKLLHQHFKKAFTKLTPRQKEIIYLRYLKGMNYEELAAIMNISVKAAYKLIARSLETLRENLQGFPVNKFFIGLLLLTLIGTL